jgi:hypothetical protein
MVLFDLASIFTKLLLRPQIAGIVERTPTQHCAPLCERFIDNEMQDIADIERSDKAAFPRL